jgi:hypothetical protein
LFEKTLLTLSQASETEVEVERSQQMWLACLEHAKAGKHALTGNQSPDGKAEVVPQPFHSDSLGGEGDRRSPVASPRNRDSSWLETLKSALMPRPGYALAGGLATVVAAVALGAALLWSPSTPAPAPVTVAALPTVPQSRANLVSFQAPPPATTGMLDYHSAMAFEPFSNHVGPTLVAYTATQP